MKLSRKRSIYGTESLMSRTERFSILSYNSARLAAAIDKDSDRGRGQGEGEWSVYPRADVSDVSPSAARALRLFASS